MANVPPEGEVMEAPEETAIAEPDEVVIAETAEVAPAETTSPETVEPVIEETVTPETVETAEPAIEETATPETVAVEADAMAIPEVEAIEETAATALPESAPATSEPAEEETPSAANPRRRRGGRHHRAGAAPDMDDPLALSVLPVLEQAPGAMEPILEVISPETAERAMRDLLGALPESEMPVEARELELKPRRPRRRPVRRIEDDASADLMPAALPPVESIAVMPVETPVMSEVTVAIETATVELPAGERPTPRRPRRASRAESTEEGPVTRPRRRRKQAETLKVERPKRLPPNNDELHSFPRGAGRPACPPRVQQWPSWV